MKWIISYFDFTKGERIASLILISLIIIVLVLPYLIKPRPPVPSDFSLLMAIAADTTYNKSSFGQNEFKQQDIIYKNFDPNTASEEELISLGFKSYLAKRILKFRKSGAVFRKPEDLYKLYGIDSQHVANLIPYIKIATKDEKYVSSNIYKKEYPKSKTFEIVELNTADTNALIALPGIGSKLAKRILAFRDKLGGFYSVDQLDEVYGIMPEYLENIKKKVRVDKNLIKLLPINSATKEILNTHPYIGYKAANIILNYRKQHGSFKNEIDLNKCMVISQENLNKLKNYIIYD